MLAHAALQQLHLLPGQLMALPLTERAFIYASLIVRSEREEKEVKALKKRK